MDSHALVLCCLRVMLALPLLSTPYFVAVHDYTGSMALQSYLQQQALQQLWRTVGQGRLPVQYSAMCLPGMGESLTMPSMRPAFASLRPPVIQARAGATWSASSAYRDGAQRKL